MRIALACALVALCGVSCKRTKKDKRTPPPQVQPNPKPQPDPIQRPANLHTLDVIERTIDDHASALTTNDERRNAAYLTFSQALNSGEKIDDYVQGTNKATNSLSFERNVHLMEGLGNGVYYLDLREIGRTRADWDDIAARSPFRFISQTARGIQLQNLLRTRYVWMPGSAFVFSGLEDPASYNRLMDIDVILERQRQKLGVDFAGDIANAEATWMAMRKTGIGAANRLIAFYDSDDGWYIQTCDPPDNTGFGNYSKFPLVAEANPVGGAADCTASMFFASLPNRGLLMGLYANNVRIEAAPVEFVQDNRNPHNEVEISQGANCFYCHNEIIPATGFMAQNLRANRDEFDPNDFRTAQGIFVEEDQVAEKFREANDYHNQFLSDLGIPPGPIDPMGTLLDRLKYDWDLGKVCDLIATYIALEEVPNQECEELLNGSATARSELSEIFQGEKVTFEAVDDAFERICIDLQCGVDPPR